MFKNPQELLNHLLEGNQLTPEHIDYLIENKIQEDLHLDYKHGKILENSKATSVLREYMSAFANSEGGVLIIGIDNKKWIVTGSKAPGGGDLAEWASTAILPIVSSFSPIPQFQVVNHPKGKILVCVTDRSLGFVYCKEGDGLKYYLRNHDQTFQAPEYLVSDIVLGRRNKPILKISNFRIKAYKSTENYLPKVTGEVLNLLFEITIENESLVWAENVVAGMLVMDKSTQNRISNNLISYLDIKHFDNSLLKLPDDNDFYNVRKVDQSKTLIRPFDQIEIKFKTIQSPIAFMGKRVQYDWHGAFYVLSQGSSPVWYQVSFSVNKRFMDLIPSNQNEPIHQKLYKYQPAINSRPIIGIENIRDYLDGII